MYIRECIYESELNLEMLYYIGLHLEEVIKNNIMNSNIEQKIIA